MRPLLGGRPSTVPSFFCHLCSTPQRNPAASPSESLSFSPSHLALRLWLRPPHEEYLHKTHVGGQVSKHHGYFLSAPSLTWKGNLHISGSPSI